MMPAGKFYPKAPIVEAAFELRFARSVDWDTVSKIADRIKHQYSTDETEQEFEALINPQGAQVQHRSRPLGRRLFSKDRTEGSLVRLSGISTIQLAPYPGWEVVLDRLKRDYKAAKKVVGGREIAQLGVRFINRIDVPVFQDAQIRIADFLLVEPSHPGIGVGPLRNYTLQFERLLDAETGAFVRISSGTVESPVPKHLGLLLDVDIICPIGQAMPDEQLWNLLQTMRIYKNEIFERCITDRTRELIAG